MPSCRNVEVVDMAAAVHDDTDAVVVVAAAAAAAAAHAGTDIADEVGSTAEDWARDMMT